MYKKFKKIGQVFKKKKSKQKKEAILELFSYVRKIELVLESLPWSRYHNQTRLTKSQPKKLGVSYSNPE